MPELPEVETIRRDLHEKLVGAVLRDVEVRLPKIVYPSKTFAQKLRGGRITDVRRRAKLLAIDFRVAHRNDLTLLIHLKMTGQLVLKHKQSIVFGGHPILGAKLLPNKYTHVIFYFRNGDILYYNDLRQFGYLKLVNRQRADRLFAAYGIEPLSTDFSLAHFETVLKGHPGIRLKALLLNQEYIAGLGNIYVDEACFRAKVRPDRTVKTLSTKEKKALWRAIKSVLGLSVKHRGTSFNTYVDADGRAGQFWKYLKVYGRTKEACKTCRTKLVRAVVAGRGTHYCPTCQA